MSPSLLYHSSQPCCFPSLGFNRRPGALFWLVTVICNLSICNGSDHRNDDMHACSAIIFHHRIVFGQRHRFVRSHTCSQPKIIGRFRFLLASRQFTAPLQDSVVHIASVVASSSHPWFAPNYLFSLPLIWYLVGVGVDSVTVSRENRFSRENVTFIRSILFYTMVLSLQSTCTGICSSLTHIPNAQIHPSRL